MRRSRIGAGIVAGLIAGVVFGVMMQVMTMPMPQLYGVLVWILGALILMPILGGMDAFSPLTMPPMRPVAMTSLVGHLLSGLILGGAARMPSHFCDTTLASRPWPSTANSLPHSPVS